MDIDQFFRNSHFSFSRTLLSITGLWPFDTKVKRYVIYFAMILLFKSAFIFQILGAMDVWHDPVEFVDCLRMILLYVTIHFKIICGVYTIPKIKLLLTKMQEYHLSPKSNKECEIYNSHATWGRKMNLAYFWFVSVHLIIFHIIIYMTRIMQTNSNKNDTSLNIAQTGVAYHVNYIVDFDTYYPLIYIHTTTCNMYLVYTAVTFDILYMTIVEHSRALFAALRYRLENALSDNDYNFSNTSTKNKCYLNVAYSARRHAETIQFVDLVNAVYSTPQLIHIGFAMLILAILEYQLVQSIEQEDSNSPLKYLNFLNAILFNVFFENWQGQRMLDSSAKVFTSAYNSEWYNMPLASRKLFRFILMRSMNPMTLMAGKFFALSYESFNTVVRTSSSYFMLLRSIT